MTKLYPLQVIALDKVSHQALDLAELTRFEETVKTEPKLLSSVTITDYHQIFVLAELSDETISEIEEELSQVDEPIVLLPVTVKESEHVRQLLLIGTRIIFAPSDSLVSVSLSQILKVLELMFYGKGIETEIAVDHQDIYTVLKKGTISEFHEGSGSNTVTTMISVMNVPKSFKDVSSAFVLYEVHKDFSLMEIAESMNMLLEDILPEDCELIFATRNTHTNMDYVKITCMVTRYYDFASALQKEITAAESYIDKVSVIVDAYAREVITNEEAEVLAERNTLYMKDLKAIYHVAYTQPIEMVELLRMMQDEQVGTQRKVEAIADVVLNESFDVDVAEEIAKMQKLSIDEILSVIQIKKEGKLLLQSMEMKSGLRNIYPNLTLAKSADTLVLLKKDDLHKESSGVLTVEENNLKRYEKEGLEWFVAKDMSEEEIDVFVLEYESHDNHHEK